MASPSGKLATDKMTPNLFLITLSLLSLPHQLSGDQTQGAVFLHEFPLIRRESHQDDFLSDLMTNHKIEDP
ncbi:Hypothetical predicted protein, partial [Pelobates cultripes]